MTTTMLEHGSAELAAAWEEVGRWTRQFVMVTECKRVGCPCGEYLGEVWQYMGTPSPGVHSFRHRGVRLVQSGRVGLERVNLVVRTAAGNVGAVEVGR